MALLPEYDRLLERGEYDSIEELCNALGLNYDDVFDYADLDDEEEDRE